MSTEYVQFTLDGAIRQSRLEEFWDAYQSFEDNPFYSFCTDRLGLNSELCFVDDEKFSTMEEVEDFLKHNTEKYGPLLVVKFGGKWVFGAKVDS